MRGEREKIGIPQGTNTPHRSVTNGQAENAVKRVNQGTSCVLYQSGLVEPWWPYAMKAFCFLHCVLDIQVEGKTAYEKRNNAIFDGPIWAVGIEVKWQPQSQKDKERVHAFGDKRLDGIFVGYSQDPGGGWNENVYVIDKLDLETKSINQIRPRKCLWQEVEPVLEEDGEVIFTLSDGEWQQPMSIIHI